MKIAVYGTLRQGNGNNRLIQQYNPVKTERLNGFRMYSYGPFPFISHDDEGEITIEIYDIDDYTFESVDHLEGYPGFYNRELVETSEGPAWIYFIDSEQSGFPEIVNGDWNNPIVERS